MPVGSASTRRGRLELICGPMFSGKSERLLEHLNQAKAEGLSTVAFKHASDDRYDSHQIVTHSGRRLGAYASPTATRLLELVGEAQLVVIDEAQFFAIDLIDVCRQLVDGGRSVVIAGLDRDSWGEPFGPMPLIEELADEVVRTRGVCSVCGAASERTQRLAPIEGTRMIGGPEAYEPRCVKCFVPPPIELRR